MFWNSQALFTAEQVAAFVSCCGTHLFPKGLFRGPQALFTAEQALFFFEKIHFEKELGVPSVPPAKEPGEGGRDCRSTQSMSMCEVGIHVNEEVCCSTLQTTKCAGSYLVHDESTNIR